MKRILKTVLLCSFVTSSCYYASPNDDSVGVSLRGIHLLRRMVYKKSQTDSFYIVSDTTNSSVYSTFKVSFLWQMNDGTYVLSSLPANKVHFNFNSVCAKPTIKFVWQSGTSARVRSEEIQRILEDYLSYAIIDITKEDSPLVLKTL
jgi:hypothetical protein